MALILQLETSTTSCSVALAENGQILSIKEHNERNIHASHITLFIEEVMKQSNKSMKDLQAVAVSMGPGSYTGLRIGVSTAKGLCYALDIPLIGIDTLKGMASGIRSKAGEATLLCPMIDARRMEVYCGVFDLELKALEPVQAKIVDADSFNDILATNTMLFFGDGAPKCKELFQDNPKAIFIDDFANSAADMTQLALDKYVKQQFEDVAYFEPYYLKDFIAGKPKVEQ